MEQYTCENQRRKIIYFSLCSKHRSVNLVKDYTRIFRVGILKYNENSWFFYSLKQKFFKT